MSGVFISYSRQDATLARRITLALRALDVDVWWDQDMPSVVWRDEIARRIGELAAVVVLWTPRSRGSDSVHDEALLGHDAKRLVNLLVELDKPPPPFHRINGLPLDGWEGVVPNEGWHRLIVTLDPMLAASGGSARGALIERLAEQETEFARRQREIQRADAAVEAAQVEGARIERLAAGARAALEKADAQVETLRSIGASRSVIAAANAETESADTAKCDAEAEVARALAAVEESGCKRDALRKGFETWVKEQGGAGRTGLWSASRPPNPADTPVLIIPVPPTPTPKPPPADPVLEVVPPGPTPDPDPDPDPDKPQPPDPKTKIDLSWAVIGGVILLVLATLMFWPRDTSISNTSANATTTVENATVATDNTTSANDTVANTSSSNLSVPSKPAAFNWLLNDWGYRGDCAARITIRSATDGGLSFEKNFSSSDAIVSHDTIESMDETTVVTSNATYVASYSGAFDRAVGLAAAATVTMKDRQLGSYWMKRCAAR